MKVFNVPTIYRSPLIRAIKQQRQRLDKMKKDFSPTLLDFGSLQIYLARHFGFCYGVENAIDIAFRTIEENPGRNIFLLSEMIHNPQVNRDLLDKGVRFLQDTGGNQLIPFDTLQENDIVITPAFGTSLEIEGQIRGRNIQTEKYNTTCPFVEKVWNRSGQIAGRHYTVIIHGKPGHEETRATFSHAAADGPALIIKDMEDAVLLAGFINGAKDPADFSALFSGRFSPGFDPIRDLQRIGVVNQTTMLASETQGIADFLKEQMRIRHGLTEISIEDHFADTRDTLCYATHDNQAAVRGMLQTAADLAIVVGGYNSSNTSHLVELCEKQLPSFFIRDASCIDSRESVRHFDLGTHMEITTAFLPPREPLRILLTSGASCPDALVEEVIEKLAGFFPGSVPLETMISGFQ